MTVGSIDALVIGASAGAIAALGSLLPSLPSTTPFPTIAVVHMPPRRPSLLAELFAPRCALPVAEPLDKQPVTPGIWFAPPDYHLLVEADRTFSLTIDEPVQYSRPSVDVLFEAAATAYAPRLAAVVLTGGNEDGAAGAKAIRDAGGLVIVQDPSTAEVSAMPLAAIAAASPQVIAPLLEIARLLRGLAGVAHSDLP